MRLTAEVVSHVFGGVAAGLSQRKLAELAGISFEHL
jgi:hypothetical protein